MNQSTATDPAQSDSPSRAARDPIVLVVGADPATLKAATAVLATEFELEFAVDGVAALAQMGRRPPEVILTDANLPRLDGLELARHLKRDLATRQIPVLLMLDAAGPYSVAECLEVGVDAILPRPLEPLELRARVRLAARQHAMYRELENKHRELADANRRLLDTQTQLLHAQKLESIGQLAAGVAHEINTPLQYVGDNAAFLRDGFLALERVLTHYESLWLTVDDAPQNKALAHALATLRTETDIDFFRSEIPLAIEQTVTGLHNVSEIVRAMKEFSHIGSREKIHASVNKAILSTVTVARHEWKYVAELMTELDPELPPVPLLVAEFSQVLLNLIVNAAHAIADVVGDGSQGKGAITISTRTLPQQIEIAVRDTGIGIPPVIRNRVFDPFFTTKRVGQGTGQGLAIARSVVVDKHGGEISFESEPGQGTTFVVRLPRADLS